MLTQKIQDRQRFSFSGHETFQCKSLWLKKGFDFINNGNKFSEESAVIDLGVGKNMVSSIRFWMRAFGMTQNDEVTELASYIFDTHNGQDPFVEDLGTLWLLHYKLVTTLEASIYPLFFIEFQKEKDEFTREQLFTFLKRKCKDKGNPNWYNDNTIKKDIGVLINNYKVPSNSKSYEDYLVLLIDLNLISEPEHERFKINYQAKQQIVPEILFYAIVDQKGNNTVISYDELIEIALIFCLSQSELDEALRNLENKFSNLIRFSDDSGIKQLLFFKDVSKKTVLDNYYDKTYEI